MAKTELKAKKYTFDLDGDGKKARNMVMLMSNYGRVRTLTKAFEFDPNTLEGEQRVQMKKRVNKLRQAIANGSYTPTAFYANITANHIVTQSGNDVTIDASEDKPLSLIDANQRRGAFDSLRAESPAMARKVDNLPIPIIIYLDADKRHENFMNLNDVQPIDGSHMTSLKVLGGSVDARLLPLMTVGRDVALALNNNEGNPFTRNIKFESSSGSPLSLKALMSDSDLSFSLIGTAKILDKWGKTAEDFASLVTEIYNAVKEDIPHVLESNKFLQLSPAGKKGNGSMWLMIANVAAYRLHLLGHDTLTENDLRIVLEAIDTVFDKKIDGDYSNKRKRELSGDFALEVFKDVEENDESEVGFHDGLPIPLHLLLTSSAFNAEPLPKPAKKRGRKPKAASAESTEESLAKPDESAQENRQDSDTDTEWED